MNLKRKAFPALVAAEKEHFARTEIANVQLDLLEILKFNARTLMNAN
jgi:hypothetical protein